MNALQVIRISALLAAVGFLFSCTPKSDVVISGNITGVENKAKLVLFRQDFDKTIFIDSLSVSPKKGKFRFLVSNISEPTFYHLTITEKRTSLAVLLVEKGEKVSLEIDMKSFNNYKVTGSEGSEKTRLLSTTMAKTVRTLDSLDRLISSSNIDSEKIKLQGEYAAAIESQREFSSKFIIDNAMSRASVMAVYQQMGPNRFLFDRAEDLYLLKVVGTSLRALYPESEYTKGILADIQNQERRLAGLRLSELVKQAENNLPEIALPNTNGDTVRLSSLRGKVILLDFWASANQANLFENQEFKKLYSTYKSKGFEIFQVSLDTNKDSWMQVVKSTELPWINVCEQNRNGSYAAQLYNVTSIPTNYLISKNFEIVGKNLYGKELERRLKELL